MNSKALRILPAVFCLSLIIGCAATSPRVPIIKPQQIDQQQAKDSLISKYANILAKTDRMGLQYATAMCRRIQSGDLQPAGVKSSPNSRYVVFMFKEKEEAGLSKGDCSIIAFYFNPLSELMRMCSEEGLCDVYVRNGVTRFGRTNIITHGEPAVNDSGITIKFNEDRSFAYDLLFSYVKSNEREADELIATFLSAFPFLFYQ
jgi:hypothetical protein